MKFLSNVLGYLKNKGVLLVMVLFPFFCFTGFFFRQNNVHIHFVDEEENIVAASYMNKGEKLYSDVFIQHQPLAYVLSGAVQKVASIGSIYELISKHRDFVILWSFIWAAGLVYYFGLSAFLTVIVIELSKIYLFGNLFLAESLVFYPLIFLMGLSLNRNKLSKSTTVLLGLAWGVSLLLLLPVWPLLLLLLLILLNKRDFRGHFRYFLLGVLAIVISTLPFISLSSYINNVFLVNFKYYLPTGSELSIRNALNSFFPYFGIFFAPGEHTKLLVIQRVFSLLYFAANIYLIGSRKYKLLLITFLILGFSNLRYIAAGLQFYQGFHCLVWFSVFVFMVIYLQVQCFKTGGKYARYLVSIVIISLPLATFFLSKDELTAKRDKDRDYYVNYSRQFSFGEAVRFMSVEGERLFVVPDEFLIYWQADVKHASKYVFYYRWMEGTPQIHNEIVGMFANNPPTFVYCHDCSTSNVGPLLIGYQRIKKEGKETDLYVRNQKVKELDQGQIEKLNYFDYEI